MKKRTLKKLVLSRETLRGLDDDQMKRLVGLNGQSCFVTCIAECGTEGSMYDLCELPYTY